MDLEWEREGGPVVAVDFAEDDAAGDAGLVDEPDNVEEDETSDHVLACFLRAGRPSYQYSKEMEMHLQWI